jgi:FeS assembly SUF system protein
VGIFSFLTGKDDEQQTTTTTTTTAEQDPKPAASPEPAAHPPAPETPFTPPEAWNTEALTQPPPAAGDDHPTIGAPDTARAAELQGPIIEAIKTVYDPEIPVDIYELGLIYDIVVDAQSNVLIKMTLTSPACPSAQQLPSEVRYKVKAVPGVTEAWVDIVWEPAWSKDRMSEAARLSLGIF